MPKVSVIIPAYNAEKFLSEAVASVVLQTFKDWECIIVNDASTDGTLNIARIWAQYDKRIKVVPLEKNVGLASARNEGAKNSQGHYLAFLDSDDIWSPHKLAHSVQVLETTKTIALINCYFQFYDNTYQIRRKVLIPFLKAPFFGYKDLLMKKVRSSIPSSLVLTRESFEEINGFNAFLPAVEDLDFLLRLTRTTGKKAFITPEFMLYYRLHKKQMSQAKWYSLVTSSNYVLARELIAGNIDLPTAKRILRRFLMSKFFLVPSLRFKIQALFNSALMDPLGFLKEELLQRIQWNLFTPPPWEKPDFKREQHKFNKFLHKIHTLIQEVMR
ncbi:MAG: glycosyltransferase family 2 protein [Chlorobi bacterium]|nr:glycosyltransferase family 2 protein [Chlorobiota bacterium]